MNISRITLREIHLPLVDPFTTADGVVSRRRVLLLEMVDRDSTHAWSECVAQTDAGYSRETVDTCWDAIETSLGRQVVKRQFESPRELSAFLAAAIPEGRMARAAIEMGAWALESERQRLPLAQLLVGESNASTGFDFAPRAQVETGIALGMQSSPEALDMRCREALAAGYRRIKIKITPQRDIAFVRAVRDSLGVAIDLSVDANRSYAGRDSADVMTELDSFSLSMIEQPLAAGDMHGHAELQRRLTTPICLDESITTLASAREMVAMGSARIINLKPGRVGGLTESIAIHDFCADAGIPVWCGGMLETGIGRAYNVALASLPDFSLPGDLSPGSRYWKNDIVHPEWTMDENACVRVPLDRVGIGVDVDTDLIDRLTVRTAVVTGS